MNIKQWVKKNKKDLQDLIAISMHKRNPSMKAMESFVRNNKHVYSLYIKEGGDQ